VRQAGDRENRTDLVARCGCVTDSVSPFARKRKTDRKREPARKLRPPRRPGPPDRGHSLAAYARPPNEGCPGGFPAVRAATWRWRRATSDARTDGVVCSPPDVDPPLAWRHVAMFFTRRGKTQPGIDERVALRLVVAEARSSNECKDPHLNSTAAAFQNQTRIYYWCTVVVGRRGTRHMTDTSGVFVYGNGTSNHSFTNHGKQKPPHLSRMAFPGVSPPRSCQEAS
jgi:hypothetical protein